MLTTDDVANMRMRIEELENAIRKYRDSAMSWENDAELWALLGDDQTNPAPLPPLPEFMQYCAAYWQSRQQVTASTRTPNVLWSAINAIRIQRDLSCVQLAEQIGVSRSTVQRWMHGIGTPRADALLAAEAWLSRQ